MTNVLLGLALASAIVQGPGPARNLPATSQREAVPARATPAVAKPAQVVITNTRRIEFVATTNGRPYVLSIALPSAPPPAGGYRVLYVLDGDYFFGSAVEAVRLNTSDVVVVGIGYPDTDEFVRGVMSKRSFYTGPATRAAAVSIERAYDLTLPSTVALLRSERLTTSATGEKDVGGVVAFLKVIEAEVKPMVAKLAPIDPKNQAIFGYSLGGLAVLHALFTEPNAFRTFIASSPSIWWAGKRVLAGENQFAAQARAGTTMPRVLVTVGGDEEVVPVIDGVSPERVAAVIGNSRMIGNGRDLVERLKAIGGDKGLHVEDLAVFPKQGHGPSAWPAIGRAVSFAFFDRSSD